MTMEYLEDFESIKEAFLARFVLSWEEFQVRSKDWIEKMRDRGRPVDMRWYDQAFLWDKMDPAYAFTSFQEALACLRGKSGSVLLMTEKLDETTRKRNVTSVARADACELADRIEEDWFESYRLAEQYMYNPDALPSDIYVFDQTMEWCVVFTHETSDIESELDDPMKAAESRCCIILSRETK
ncbi:MAG: hypothetical protein J5636_02065 [Clostridiales bacterium]|nr:hypothetical protein [Clostridiales bacterium]